MRTAPQTRPFAFDGTKLTPATYGPDKESPALTHLVLILHVVAGTIALFAGIFAMSSRKGAHTPDGGDHLFHIHACDGSLRGLSRRGNA
ncbi:MAG: hypothetical protein ACLPMG_02160 [Terriglobales bacterium]